LSQYQHVTNRQTDMLIIGKSHSSIAEREKNSSYKKNLQYMQQFCSSKMSVTSPEELELQTY